MKKPLRFGINANWSKERYDMFEKIKSILTFYICNCGMLLLKQAQSTFVHFPNTKSYKDLYEIDKILKEFTNFQIVS
jgi:hypothetical protein